MADKIIIDGIDISECNYAILPKHQCPMKSMPYAKETSCIACKEHCKNNPNCYFKQLKRAEQKLEKIKEIVSHCKEQTGCIGCKYEDECDASYNFENWILKIMENKKDE